jgi:single-strand DNA-binding protein
VDERLVLVGYEKSGYRKIRRKMSTQVTMTGNPTLRATKTGSSLLTVGLAVTRRWRDKQDNWEEQTSFFDVTAWGELADNSAASLSKGNKVVVVGRLEQQEWTDKNDGSTKRKVVVIADDIAVSLRKATVEGVAKSGNPAAQSGQQYQNTGKKPAATSFLGDEEPF